MAPDIMEGKGLRFFPMFSQVAQMPEEYRQQRNVILIPTEEALNMAHQVENLDGIVLDAFSQSVAMPFATCDMIYEITGLAK